MPCAKLRIPLPVASNLRRRETANVNGSMAALFQRLTQGVYVVGVARGETRDAFTAAWVMQVSYDPLLLALSINANHSSYRLLKEGRLFSVNVLKKGQLVLADRYGRPDRADKAL